MLVAKAVVLLAAVLLVPVAILLAVSVGLGNVASALATRGKVARRFATAIRVGVATVVAFVGTLGVVIAFGVVANADASRKATMLARGISELMSCTPFAMPVAAAAVATLFWFAWRLARRWSGPTGRA